MSPYPAGYDSAPERCETCRNWLGGFSPCHVTYCALSGRRETSEAKRSYWVLRVTKANTPSEAARSP